MTLAPPEHERGFILITAMWLLVLCSAIAALLMLRSRNAATAISAEETSYRQHLLLHDAAETAIADLLFSGARSRWAIVPVTAGVTIDGQPVSVTVTSEAGRVDVNDGDPRVIDAALQGLAVGSRERARILFEIIRRRAAGRRFTGSTDTAALLAAAQVEAGTGVCLNGLVTTSSGLTRPSTGAMPSVLAKALAEPQGGEAEPLLPGTPVRFEVTAGSARMTLIERIDRPSAAAPVFDLVNDPLC